MKNTILILLLLLLPWQVITATERNFTHVIGNAQSEASFVKHFTEHVDQVLHHHDDDDKDHDTHEDDSQESFRHLADVDHGFSLHVLLPTSQAVDILPVMSGAPMIPLDSYSDRTTLPLLRPPRTLA